MGTVAVSWCFGNEVAALFMSSVQLMMNHDRDKSGHIRSVISDHAHVNITNARNNIIRRFMQDEQSEWLLMLDTDMMVPPDLIDILLSKANNDVGTDEYTPFIGGLCFTIDDSGDIYPTLFEFKPDQRGSKITVINEYPENDMMEVDATGSACLLLHKPALVQMYEAYNDDIFPWFKEYEYEHTALSEDLGFMLRAKRLGLKTYVHTGAKVGHFKPFVIDEHMFRKQQNR